RFRLFEEAPPVVRLHIMHVDQLFKRAADGHRHSGNAMSRLPDRRLPSLDALRVFEASARHASFTKAAKELHITQTAVSHRIRNLETDLGIVLFRRLTRRLELTAEGERLAHGIREGLERIQLAILDLDDQVTAGPLVVSMLPSFAARWLLPRLPRFNRVHPDIAVQVQAEPELADLRAGNVHLAIRFGRGRYPGLSVTPLMSATVVPVCSPRLLERYGPIESVDDLLRVPWLYDSEAERDNSGTDWKSWLVHVGSPRQEPDRMGQHFSQAHLAIDAAV